MASTSCAGDDVIVDNPVRDRNFANSSEYIAVFGDIQYYTNSTYINLFQQSLDWILSASDSLNIVSVLHTGDITQSNNINKEWRYFKEAMTGFSDKIPFISMIGDHDYTWELDEKRNTNSFINDRYSTHFNEYISFPNVTSRIEAAFEADRMENIVVHNVVQGERLDFLLLEFGPRKEVVEWANQWVSSHPDIKYVLMNHEYLEKGGGRRTSGLKCQARLNNTTYTTPEELWEQLVKPNDNILGVLCGHVGGLYALTLDENDFGRKVPQIQHNIQSAEYRYDNWLMLWEFPADSDSVNVSIYNTQTRRFFEDKPVLIRFGYRN